MAYDLKMPRSKFFSPSDEDEEDQLNALIAQQAEQAGAPFRVDPLLLKDSGPGVPSLSEDLDADWQQAERKALSHANYDPNEYGLGEFARDTGAGAIASILDIGFNKGRGLGGIAQGVSDVAQNSEAMRQKRAAQQGDFSLKARDAREGKGYKDAQAKHWDALDNIGGQRLTISGQNAGTAAEREARIAEDAKRRHDTDTPESERKIDALRQNGVPESMIAGRSSEELDKLLSIYSKQVDLANAPRTTAIAVDRAGKEANAKNASELGYAAPTATQKELGSAAGKIATAGAVNAAEGKVPETTKAAEASRGKFTTETESAQKVARSIASVLSNKQEGQDIPGLSRAETIANMVPGGRNFVSDAAAGVLQDLDIAIEGYSRDQSGAAIGVKEDAKFLKQVMGDPTASPERREAAIRKFQASNDAYIASKAAVNPEAAEQVLSATGLVSPSRMPKPRQATVQVNPGAPGTVKMRSPTGAIYDVPPNKQKSAIAAQWTKVQ